MEEMREALWIAAARRRFLTPHIYLKPTFGGSLARAASPHPDDFDTVPKSLQAHSI